MGFEYGEGEVWFTPEGGEEQFLGYSEDLTFETPMEEDDYSWGGTAPKSISFNAPKSQKQFIEEYLQEQFGKQWVLDTTAHQNLEKMNDLIKEKAPSANPTGHQLAMEFVRLVPSLGYQFLDTCPNGGCNSFDPKTSLFRHTCWFNLRWVVIHLNDTHKWTREDIADWLDTLPSNMGVDINVYESDSERIRWADELHHQAFRSFETHKALGLGLVSDSCSVYDVRPVWDTDLHDHLSSEHGWGVTQLNKAAKILYEGEQ